MSEREGDWDFFQRALRSQTVAEFKALVAARDASIREEALRAADTEPPPPRCAACTWPNDFASHPDWCVVGRILATLGPVDDDWRWTGEVNLRATIRAALDTPAQTGGAGGGVR